MVNRLADHDTCVRCGNPAPSGELCSICDKEVRSEGDKDMDRNLNQRNGKQLGIYVASRASIPERSAMWRKLRDTGVPITSSWIDEAGEGETASFGELWPRIVGEIARSTAILFYAEPSDLPLKGAFVEAGIAIGMGIPVYAVLPGIGRGVYSFRPIGSWLAHPLVTRIDDVMLAVDAALKGAGEITQR
jgi:hypothetical protein